MDLDLMTTVPNELRGPRPLGVWVYLGFALRGEVLLDKQGPESHSKVFVGLSQAEPAQVQLLLRAVDLPGKLVDGAAESGGQVFAERRHDAPQHVVVENPANTVPDSLNLSGFHPSRFILKALFPLHLLYEKKLVKPIICLCGRDVDWEPKW